MKTRRFTGFVITLLLALLAFVPPARSQATEHIKLNIEAAKEVTVVDKTGTPKVELVEPKLVVPGDEIIYKITYTNAGKEPTTSVVVTNRIPPQMTYVRDTAGGSNTNVLFSVNGADYATRDKVTVRTPEGETRPATEQDLAYIRWVVNAAVLPGEAGTVSYRARLQ